MRIAELYRHQQPVLSIEVFPPKTERGRANLLEWLQQVDRTAPGFISVTYGAGGSSRQGTHDLCAHIKRHLSTECVAHLTCATHTQDQITETLDRLAAAGVENLMALRGDPPEGQSVFLPPAHGFAHAVDLVRELRRQDRFGIAVAGYPEGHIEASSYELDLGYQIEKVRAGADVIVSQFFLDNQAFFKWRQDLRAAGLTLPIVAGILPAQSLAQIERFAGFCGVAIPKSLRAGLAKRDDDPEAAARLGIEHAVGQVRELLAAGVDGIHLYALNKMAPVEALTPLFRTARG